MDLTDIVYKSFRDELEKISGLSRIGRTPMLPGTISSKAAVGRAAKGLGKFFKTKISAGFTAKHMLGATASGGALALYGQHKLKKMHEEYQTGRMMRQQ